MKDTKKTDFPVLKANPEATKQLQNPLVIKID